MPIARAARTRQSQSGNLHPDANRGRFSKEFPVLSSFLDDVDIGAPVF
ncbi:MAG: hypothetical protein WBL37_08690 [Dehalococcoidales bacterium]